LHNANFQGDGKVGYKAGEKCATVRAGWWWIDGAA